MVRAYGGTVARHVTPKARPGLTRGLDPAHPALAEGRSLFPTTVVLPSESPRLFVDGRNNPKLGGEVRKGALRGFPIYHLTLEERATCPRSCAVWSDCYGNSMHRARRHRHGRALEKRIATELRGLAGRHPGGFLVRLHTLGDFYSIGYVALWARLLVEIPALHVFGYTARNEFDDDGGIAAAVASLADANWDRFAIRFSRAGGGPQSAVVVDEDPARRDVVLCPAQTGATQACATCGLCWAPAARDKAIAFLRHGMVRAHGPRRPKPPPLPKRGTESPVSRALLRLAAAGDSVALKALARKRGTDWGQMLGASPLGLAPNPDRAA